MLLMYTSFFQLCWSAEVVVKRVIRRDRTNRPLLFRDRISNCTNLFRPEPNRTTHADPRQPPRNTHAADRRGIRGSESLAGTAIINATTVIWFDAAEFRFTSHNGRTSCGIVLCVLSPLCMHSPVHSVASRRIRQQRRWSCGAGRTTSYVVPVASWT